MKMETPKEPGSARFGNFINYYDFNPPERRIKLIPNDLLKSVSHGNDDNLIILDIGCNAGVTIKCLKRRTIMFLDLYVYVMMMMPL